MQQRSETAMRIGSETSMVKERSVDEYLGFARKPARQEQELEPPPAQTPARDAATHDTGADDADAAGAYEDSWYQVLKAKAEEAEDDADD